MFLKRPPGHRSGICCVLGINWKPLYDCMTYTYNIWVLWNIKLFFSGDTGLFLATSHYLNQCWNIVDWNKLQWNFNRNSYKRIHLKMSSGKQRPFCLGFNMLTLALLMLDTGRITLCEKQLLDIMAAISKTVFSDAFSWMKMFQSWLEFHWNMLLGFELPLFEPMMA